MRTVIIIPARFSSVRYPGKPLVKLSVGNGAQKSLIQLSWEAASRVKNVDEVFVATDDKRIRFEAESFGARVIMTSKKCKNGTERCAEALKTLNFVGDIVVNFQGDAPLTPEWFVEDLIRTFERYPNTQMATPVLRLDEGSLKEFRLDRRSGRVGGTTVVFDKNLNALYFSKELIPFFDEKKVKQREESPVFHHVGVYAYRTETLLNYSSWKESNLEVLEGLEQLRFLENACAIKCVIVDSRGRTFWELNNPEDVLRIEKVINKKINRKVEKNENT
jgi:3-deoxy-manno-octulosonate cytidylyltransferase (CMP-KDO synthetase)